MVAHWDQSRRIREFVRAVEIALAEAKEKNAKTPDLSDWVSWVHAYADSIDPIHTYLQFQSGDRTIKIG